MNTATKSFRQMRRASATVSAARRTQGMSQGQQSTGSTADAQSSSRHANIYAMGKILAMQVARERQILGRKAANMREEHGIPVREGLTAMYKVMRDKSVRELLTFMLFSGVLFSISLLLYDVHNTFATNDALRDLFLDEEFPGSVYKKNFYEIMTEQETWQWLRGPVLSGFFQTEWYNGDPYTEDELGYTLYYYRVVGGVQIRQIRVTNHSCGVAVEENCVEHFDPWQNTTVCLNRFENRYDACYGRFSSEMEDRAPMVRGNKTFYWSDGWSELDGLFGYGYSYGRGGYVVELPAGDADQAAQILEELETVRFTDAGTRALAVFANLYNTNTRKLTVMRMLLEIFESGMFIKSTRFYTVPVVLYETDKDLARAVLEAVFIIGLAYYFIKQGKRLYRTPRWKNYFMRFSNWFELLLLVLLVIIVVQWARYVSHPQRRFFDVNEANFVDWFDTAYLYIQVASWDGAVGLLCALKIFQYLNVNRQMNVLWLTLYRALTDLAAFVVSFFIVVAGFAYMGEMTFGYVLQEFKSFSFSFVTLLRYPLGDFAYDDLSLARPEMAGPFFTLYVALVFLVVMNIIIAIVTKYFDDVHDDLKTQDRWKGSSQSFEASLAQRVNRYMRMASRSIKRSCKACAKRCCRKGGDDEPEAPPSSLSRSRSRLSMADESVEDELEDQELETWNQEALYLEELHNCVRLAKRLHDIDLFAHFEQVYRESGNDDFMFIEWEELVDLTTKGGSTQFQPPPEAHPDCPATKVLRAYHDLKDVVMVGRCVKHERVLDECRHFNFRSYRVWKVNRSGARLRRTIFVDDEKAQILNFHGERLTKRLPLTQLVQIERFARDPTSLTLVFTSQGVPEEEEDAMGQGGLETTFRLSFPTEDRAQEFYQHVTQAKQQLHERIAALEHELGGMAGMPFLDPAQGGDSKAKRGNRRKQRGSKKPGNRSSNAMAGASGTSSFRAAANALRGVSRFQDVVRRVSSDLRAGRTIAASTPEVPEEPDEGGGGGGGGGSGKSPPPPPPRSPSVPRRMGRKEEGADENEDSDGGDLFGNEDDRWD